jgi:hypothetical protein
MCMPDSDAPFDTSNGVHGATSRSEWEFVTAPSDERSYVDRQWSEEQRDCARAPVPLAQLEVKMAGVNARLRAANHVEMVAEELVGGRMYTGAMYEKLSGGSRTSAAAPRSTRPD